MDIKIEVCTKCGFREIMSKLENYDSDAKEILKILMNIYI